MATAGPVCLPRNDQSMRGAANQIHELENKAQKAKPVTALRNRVISCFISSTVCGSVRLRWLRAFAQATSIGGINA
jgi:hypothetical protein